MRAVPAGSFASGDGRRPRRTRKERRSRCEDGIKSLGFAKTAVQNPVMTDVLFLAVLTAFFALCVVFVKACDKIIGPDTEAQRAETDAAAATDAGTKAAA